MKFFERFNIIQECVKEKHKIIDVPFISPSLLFPQQGNIVKEKKGEDLGNLTLWLFASNGVTENAKKIIKEHCILWSTKEDLNALLTDSNLRKLPEMD